MHSSLPILYEKTYVTMDLTQPIMSDGGARHFTFRGELAPGRRTVGNPQLRYEDVCERDMKELDINLGGPCSRPHEVEKHPEPTPQDRGREADEYRSRKRGPQKGAQQLQQTRDHTQMRVLWQRLFSHIGLYSHKRRCNNHADRTSRMYSSYQT